MFDYHVHTPLCNHARGTMNAYVQRAIEIGLEEICFLDHLTLQETGRQNSMTAGEVPLYFQETQTLKRLYNGQIHVKSGLEIDYDPQSIDLVKQITETFEFDVIGSSIHFIDGENVVSRSSKWCRGKLDTGNMVSRYIEKLKEMLDHDYFDVVCHLDIIKKFGADLGPVFLGAIEPVLLKIKDNHMAVELNTGGLRHPVKEVYPGLDILTRCAQLKIPICTGSDAHTPEMVGTGFDKAAGILKSVGIDRIAVFNCRKIDMIPIHYP